MGPAPGGDKDGNGGGGASGPGGPGGNKGNGEADLADWKKCVMARATKDRSTWCENNFASEFLKKKCENKFCDTCCDKSVEPNSKNVNHMCKKGCFRASISVENNKEYKNVCITSPNNIQNIYNFCNDKFDTFNPNMMSYCKLDMCNLCCVGMDTIKNKNYSVPNLKACFKDCAQNWNIVPTDRHIPTSKNGDVPTGEQEDCLSPAKINLKDLNNQDKFESGEDDEAQKRKAAFFSALAKGKK